MMGDNRSKFDEVADKCIDSLIGPGPENGSLWPAEKGCFGLVITATVAAFITYVAAVALSGCSYQKHDSASPSRNYVEQIDYKK